MINEFKGKYECFSNFYMSLVQYEEEYYPSVEHAFQALKAKNEEDRKKIQNADTPAMAKKLGRKVDMRPDWEQVKIGIMKSLVKDKFYRSSKLKEILLSTGDEELQEGNWWKDRFWGVDLKTGEGQNHLGKILQQVREEFRSNG